MGRTPLISRLQDAVVVAGESSRRGIDVEEVLEERRLTRRRLLRDAGAAAIAVSAAGALVPRARGAAQPRIVIVGAGLAGLACAHRLVGAGYAPEVYEASSRIGGRCWSIRDAFDEGQIAEHGGELIDQSHNAIRQLAQSFGLPLDNLLQAEQNGTEMLGYFDGSRYTFTQATNDLKQIWQQVHSDISAASYPTQYNLSTQRGRELDAMSITQWIASYVPGGTGSKLGQLLDVAYNIEYGAECSVQSSLNMLYLLGYAGQGQMRIFGKSNEKFHVRGGNDQIVEGLRQAIERVTAIHREHELVAIAPAKGAGTPPASFTLTFKNGTTTKTVAADHVVLALPFTILRSSVSYSKMGFPLEKSRAIAELGMGTNSKLHLQFSNRHWRTLGSNGETYSDRGYQNSWEVTRAQSGTSGILVDYTGGNVGASFGSGTASSRAQEFLAQIEPVLPGISARWNQKATLDFWTAYPWTKGSYSYWKVGQYTRFGGAEGARWGNCHFAGEHTSVDFQGYLNGGVETGQRAAGEILGDLK